MQPNNIKPSHETTVRHNAGIFLPYILTGLLQCDRYSLVRPPQSIARDALSIAHATAVVYAEYIEKGPQSLADPKDKPPQPTTDHVQNQD